MSLPDDRHLYWLAWLSAAMAVYFIVSAFYITSQGRFNSNYDMAPSYLKAGQAGSNMSVVVRRGGC